MTAPSPAAHSECGCRAAGCALVTVGRPQLDGRLSWQWHRCRGGWLEVLRADPRFQLGDLDLQVIAIAWPDTVVAIEGRDFRPDVLRVNGDRTVVYRLTRIPELLGYLAEWPD
jgi:hypothetical protein